MSRWVLDIPAARHMSLNARNHWSVDAEIKAEWRMLAAAHAKRAIPRHLGPVQIVLHAYPPTNHRRDADNLTPNLKAAVDGLRDAGVLVDDTPEQVVRSYVQLHKSPGGSRRWVWRLEVQLVDVVAVDCGARLDGEAGRAPQGGAGA